MKENFITEFWNFKIETVKSFWASFTCWIFKIMKDNEGNRGFGCSAIDSMSLVRQKSKKWGVFSNKGSCSNYLNVWSQNLGQNGDDLSHLLAFWSWLVSCCSHRSKLGESRRWERTENLIWNSRIFNSRFARGNSWVLSMLMLRNHEFSRNGRIVKMLASFLHRPSFLIRPLPLNVEKSYRYLQSKKHVNNAINFPYQKCIILNWI